MFLYLIKIMLRAGEIPVLIAPMWAPVSVSKAASTAAERTSIHATAQSWAVHVLQLRPVTI